MCIVMQCNENPILQMSRQIIGDKSVLLQAQILSLIFHPKPRLFFFFFILLVLGWDQLIRKPTYRLVLLGRSRS